MKSTRKIFRSAVILAMMPLIVVGTRPATGCTCSDGHYKPVCFEYLQGAGGQGAEGHCCSCCYSSSGDASANCCPSAASGPGGDCTHSSPRKGKGCCNPDSPTLLVISDIVKVAPSVALLTIDLPFIEVVHSSTFSVEIARAAYDESGPPEFDRVIALRHLLI